jgi:hypothetical protein
LAATYHAFAVDSLSNRWEVTAETAFSIDLGAGGSWSGNVYTSQNTGTWTVTGTYLSLSGTAALTVTPGVVPTCDTFHNGGADDTYIWQSLPANNYTTSATLYTGIRNHATRGPGETRLLLRFALDSIPQGSLVTSATLGITVFGTNPSQTISLYRITSPWNEVGGATWNTMADAYDPTVQGSFVAQSGSVTSDVTGLVEAWVSGENPNYGMMMINTDDQTLNTYRSGEYATIAQRPSLQVCYVAAP